jgi:hypothetical protein
MRKLQVLAIALVLFGSLPARAGLCSRCDELKCMTMACPIVPATWQWTATETCTLAEAAALASAAENEVAVVKTKDSMPRYVVFKRVFGDFVMADGPIAISVYATATDATMAHNAESEPNKGVVTTASGPAIFWKALGSMSCQ